LIVPPAGPVVGVGIDLVEVGRMRRVLERTPRFTDRVFTQAEWAYCSGRHDPAMHAAARFAAKEAVLKALGRGMFEGSLQDIEVVRTDSGPTIVLSGDHATAAAGVAGWHLSLTHTETTAAAVAVAVGRG
jgi:holo-[acyl-carrier protein] synthase